MKKLLEEFIEVLLKKILEDFLGEIPKKNSWKSSDNYTEGMPSEMIEGIHISI